jgi:hypothetical protein
VALLPHICLLLVPHVQLLSQFALDAPEQLSSEHIKLNEPAAGKKDPTQALVGIWNRCDGALYYWLALQISLRCNYLL